MDGSEAHRVCSGPFVCKVNARDNETGARRPSARRAISRIMGKILKLDDMLAPVSPAGRRPSRLAGEVFDAAQRAQIILSEAEAEARRIRAQSELELEQARAAGIEAGRQEGLAQVAQLIAHTAVERDRMMAAAERELVLLALSIARKILDHEVAHHTPVVEMTRRALEQVRHAPVVLLRVHPEEIELVRSGERGLAAVLSNAPGITVRADSSVARGGVVVETEGGSIDARLETQLAVLGKALEEATPR